MTPYIETVSYLGYPTHSANMDDQNATPQSTPISYATNAIKHFHSQLFRHVIIIVSKVFVEHLLIHMKRERVKEYVRERETETIHIFQYMM